MAWEPKYRVGNYDLGGIQWTAVFHFDGIHGAVTTLKGGGSPIKFEFQNGSDDVFDPWHPSQVIVSIKVEENNFTLVNELYSTEPMHCMVEIFEGDEASSAGDPYWKGYVDPSQLKEPYDNLPYDIEVTCIDGLVLLEQIPFYDTVEDLIEDSGEPYNNRLLETHIVRTILGKIGYDEFKEFIDLYEQTMGDTVDDSPMDQLKIDVDVFQDMMCDEVFIHILKKYNAWIRQINGVFNIFRPLSLKNTTVYGRWFSTDSISTSINYPPEHFINRREFTITSLTQVGGGVKMKQTPASKVRLNFDYGSKESWIDNWELKASTWTGTTFDFWTVHSHVAGDVQRVSDVVKGEEGAYLRIISGGDPTLKQTFGELAVQGDDFIIFEFDYSFYNITASQINGIVGKIRIQQGDHTLDEAGVWKLYLASMVMPAQDILPGFSEWTSFRLEVPRLPSNGNLVVTVYPPVNGNVAGLFKNIRFYATTTKTLSKQVRRKFRERVYGMPDAFRLKSKFKMVKYDVSDENIVEHIITKQNNIHGNELDYDYILGDIPNISVPANDADTGLLNVLSQFAGALSLDSTRFSLPDTATEFVLNHSGPFTDVDVSSAGATLIFTAGVPGVDFTAPAAIVNLTGNLSGIPSTIITNQTGSVQVLQLAFTGSSGSVSITVDGNTQAMSWVGGSIEASIDNYIALYGSGGTNLFTPIVISKSGTDTLVFTGSVYGGDPFAYSWTNGGLVVDHWSNADPVESIARVDQIVLSGSSGTATVSCDGDDAVATVQTTNTISPTTLWHKGNTIESSGEGDYKPLLDIIGDEIAEQYSRPKELIQMPIQDTGVLKSGIDLLGRFIDIYNVDEDVFKIKTIDVSWEVFNCTMVLTNGVVRLTSTNTTQYIQKTSGIAIDGKIHNLICVRYKIISGTPGMDWELKNLVVYYSNASHGISGDYYTGVDLINDGEWHIVVIDMNALILGGADWVASTITDVRFDFGTNNNFVVDVAWIGFPKIFVANRGSFDEHNRTWELDLIELI